MDLDCELPINHRNHQLERLSEVFLDTKFPIQWVKNRFAIDYGTDYNCEVGKDNGVTGINFTIQLKGKETDSNDNEVSVVIKRSTINRWNNRLEPTMIIVYIADENEAYWSWLDNVPVDLTKSNNTFTVKIQRTNKLSIIDWNAISIYLQTIFSRKNLLYTMPEITPANKDGWELYFNQEFEAALPLLKSITVSEPDGEIWNAVAVCQYNLYRYQEAIVSINKALDYEENFISLSNKAAILTEQGYLANDNQKIEQAIVIYNKLTHDKNASATVYSNFGSALTKLGKFEEALEQFENAIEINPNRPQMWSNLGNVHMHLGNHKNEMICYDNALLLEPDLPEALFSKGSSLFKHFERVDEGLELMLCAAAGTTRYEFDFPYLFWWISHAYLYKDDITNAKLWNQKGLNTFSTDSYLLEQQEDLIAYYNKKI